ncbi:MAG TPA: hypothetical protein VE953_21265 [Terriglobales bacterium]|nr:hypothetical protein [Terriglobales bacterium]
MLRPLATAGAAVALLALAACGHHAAAAQPPPQDSSTLGAYLMDAAPPSPAPTGQTGQLGQAGQIGQAPQAPQAPGQLPASACGQAQDAYRVLVFLVSSDTGTSVQTIVADLRAGQTLQEVAGSKASLVQQQAMRLVDAWLQFAEANGSLTPDQATWYRTIALGVIGGLLTANVANCIPPGA